MIESVRKEVEILLNNDKTGHAMDHINRVLNMAIDFAEKEKANTIVVQLIVLLHDVDDYKLFGNSGGSMPNAKRILNAANVPLDMQKEVLDAIKTIGYSKRLKGLIPQSIEAKVASDADMCDTIGASGIIRSYNYKISKNDLFFDENIFPNLDMSAKEYTHQNSSNPVVTHMFEKLLRLKDLMLTSSGQKEAIKRHEFMIDFLYHFFEEEKAYKWIAYLDSYINKK